jgi:Ca-activated chloride channel family protein
MNFARPELLWLFTLFVPVLIWGIRGRLRRRRDWQALAQRGRVSRQGTLALVGSIACLIVALAQPRWGSGGSGTLPPGHDVVLIVDVSRSMAAQDAVPYRLAAAIEVAESLVRALAPKPTDRVGLVGFAGRGVLFCPLTENLGAVLDALHRLRPGAVRPGGTDLGAALDAAMDAVKLEEHAQGRAFVVLSDGEDHPGRWASRLDRLRQNDIVVHTIAIGDPERGQSLTDEKTSQPLVYRGQPVISQRSDLALEAIARETGGTLVKLGLASGDLGSLYQTKIEPLARQRREASRLADRVERFPLLLFAALTLLVAGCMPAGRGWSWTWRWMWGWRPPARGFVLGGLVAALAGMATGAAQAPPTSQGETAAEALRRGTAAYDGGKTTDALPAFEAAILRAPKLAVPRYNAAATLFRLERYAEARQRYLEARERAGNVLRVKIDYALGNTALMQGDIAAAIAHYDECLASTDRRANLDQVRSDAAINRQFALEQSQALAFPQGMNSDQQSPSQRPDGRGSRNPSKPGDTSPDGQSEADPGGGGGNPDADSQGDPEHPALRRRRMRGAGGTGSSSAGARGDSPDDRLDAALENIRAAENRRLAEEPPPDAPAEDGKDW